MGTSCRVCWGSEPGSGLRALAGPRHSVGVSRDRVRGGGRTCRSETRTSWPRRRKGALACDGNIITKLHFLPWLCPGASAAAALPHTSGGSRPAERSRLLSPLFAQRLRPLHLGSPACWEMWHSLQTGENGNLPLELARLQGR